MLKSDLRDYSDAYTVVKGTIDLLVAAANEDNKAEKDVGTINSTHTYVVLENILFSTNTPLILLVSAFFGKNSTFTQSDSMGAVLETF